MTAADILVIDDDPNVLRLLGKVLERAGHHVTATGSAEDALEHLAARPFSLVLADVNLPGTSGLSLIQRIGSEFPSVATMAITGNDDPVLARDAARSGAYALIAKPFDHHQLLIDVAAAVEKHSGHLSLQRDIATLQNEVNVARTDNEELESRVAERTAALTARTEELARVVEELEAFAHTVSHDLRAPLRAMDGFSRILLEELEDRLDPTHARYLRHIRENAQGMQRLVDGLLSFSRLGRRKLERRNVSPVLVARQALFDLNVEPESTPPRVTVHDMPDAVADPTLLRTVYVNLIGNALKFTRDETSPEVEIGSVQENGETVYLVADNGIGFESEYSEKIFGVFERLCRSEDYEGTGIGLANVKRIIERHGGRVWCMASPGEGATFFFTLSGRDES